MVAIHIAKHVHNTHDIDKNQYFRTYQLGFSLKIVKLGVYAYICMDVHHVILQSYL